jgi:hypothetical protein
MFAQVLLRFVMGGLSVSCFAAIGQGLKPDRFAGIFAAAPAVAIISLALSAEQHSTQYVAMEAHAMALGAIALAVYSLTVARLMRVRRLPVWVAAAASWLVWIGVAATFRWICLP